MPDSEAETPEVLGLDDWAYAKGRRYGTLLVDLQGHRPIDLLPDRESATVAAWLQAHPGVHIVARDRSGEYAAGVTEGAPEAIQVADRWHLLKNLGEALQHVLESHASELRRAARQFANQSLGHTVLPSPEPPATPPVVPTPSVVSYRQLRFDEVKALQAQGYSRGAVARQLRVHRRTASRYFAAQELPARSLPPQNRSSAIAYFPYFRERLAVGCHNRTQLWQEIRALGYSGSYASVWRALARLDPGGTRSAAASPPPPPVPRLSPRQAMWLLVQPPEQLDADRSQLRDILCQCCLAAAQAYPLAQRFVQLIADRGHQALDAWLMDVIACPLLPLRGFTRSLQKDYACVRAALELPWSNGQTEAQVNRLKFVKRSMYGRAKFDLLRLRVLYSGP